MVKLKCLYNIFVSFHAETINVKWLPRQPYFYIYETRQQEITSSSNNFNYTCYIHVYLILLVMVMLLNSQYCQKHISTTIFTNSSHYYIIIIIVVIIPGKHLYTLSQLFNGVHVYKWQRATRRHW